MEMNSVLGENLEDLLREQVCQRSARQSVLLYSVQEENIKDLRVALHHQELECRRNRRLEKIQDCRHFHQLFRQLGIANRGTRRDVVNEDLGHINNLLGNRKQRIKATKDVHQLLSHQNGALSPICSTVCRGQAATQRQAHLRRQLKSTQYLPPGEWDAPERGRVVLLVPTPRPCPPSAAHMKSSQERSLRKK